MSVVLSPQFGELCSRGHRSWLSQPEMACPAPQASRQGCCPGARCGQQLAHLGILLGKVCVFSLYHVLCALSRVMWKHT